MKAPKQTRSLRFRQIQLTLSSSTVATENLVTMTMREQEVGVFDFVLLDEITMEKFMQNLKKR